MLEIKQLTRLQIIRYCEKLEEENKTLKDNVEFIHSCLDDRDKSIEIMKEENKKIKADYIKLSKIVETTWGYKASYVNELRDKIAKLEFDIEAWKKWKKEMWI